MPQTNGTNLLANELFFGACLFDLCICDRCLVSNTPSQAYDKGLEEVKGKLDRDNPSVTAFQLDAWTAHHSGYMGGILSECTLVNLLYEDLRDLLLPMLLLSAFLL